MNFARLTIAAALGLVLVTPISVSQANTAGVSDKPLADQSSPRGTTAFDGASWWQSVTVLASDEMEGRETGSNGLRKAAAYIVGQLQHAGLQPAGTQGFYQEVKFTRRQIDESRSSLTLVRNGIRNPLILGQDAIFNAAVDLARDVDAGVVFVGYGLKVPEKNYDDFEGLNLHGKVAVFFSGAPASLPGPLASHYQSLAERAKALRESGAVGFISIPNPVTMDIPWDGMAPSRSRPSMALADPGLRESKGIRLALTFNPAEAEKLFQGSGHTFQEVAALGKARKNLPEFPLTGTIRAHATVITKQIESANVIAKYPGEDPRLSPEYVVLSAHMDHLGVGSAVSGHHIYNGAMDNGSGCALLLDVAKSFASAHTKLRRSLLFVFLTAEEQGLLGSRYFAARPTVPKGSMVADINTDMFLPLFPLQVLVVFGLEESDLGDALRAVALARGVEVQPDPMPELNIFIRSDQYSFVKQGIPSLMMNFGSANGSPQEQILINWITKRYHTPADDLNQPVDLAAAGKFEDIIADFAVKIANSSQRPAWKPDSFFRAFAASANTGY